MPLGGLAVPAAGLVEHAAAGDSDPDLVPERLVWSYDSCDTVRSPLPSSGPVPLVSHANRDSGSTHSSAMKPSVEAREAVIGLR